MLDGCTRAKKASFNEPAFKLHHDDMDNKLEISPFTKAKAQTSAAWSITMRVVGLSRLSSPSCWQWLHLIHTSLLVIANGNACKPNNLPPLRLHHPSSFFFPSPHLIQMRENNEYLYNGWCNSLTRHVGSRRYITPVRHLVYDSYSYIVYMAQNGMCTSIPLQLAYFRVSVAWPYSTHTHT